MADIHVAIVEAFRAGKTHEEVAQFFGLSRNRAAQLVQQARKHGMEYIRNIRDTKTRGRHNKQLPEEEYAKKVLARILARTEPSGECLIWQGFKYQSRGSDSWYGSTNYHKRNWRVHRLVAHLTQRPAETGECVMHLCDNSLCVNPKHLAYGSLQENLQDAKRKGSYRYHESHYKACKNGHEFTAENTRICKNGFRHCKACEKLVAKQPKIIAWRREYQKRRRALKRQQQGAPQ